jgi:uncharacterized membrane protein (UPF0127 family)
MHDSKLNGTAEYGTTHAPSLVATQNSPSARFKTRTWMARAAASAATIAPATIMATIMASIMASIMVATLSACSPSQAPQTMEVTAGGRTFTCRLAINEAARDQGLGGVASLGPNEGMIFAFPDAEPHNFWMRRCIMDIDIAFIDPLGIVTAVHTMKAEELQRPDESEAAYFARLKKYPSLAPAQFALEVAPGTLEPLGVRRGSRIEFDRDLLKRLAE